MAGGLCACVAREARLSRAKRVRQACGRRLGQLVAAMASYIPDTNLYMGALSFDVGTTTRAGFAGDDMPRATFPSVVNTGFAGDDES